MRISPFLALLILAPFMSKEQTYVPFPDSNAVWQEVLLPYPPGPMPAYLQHFHYSVSGDTLINDISYKKLFVTIYNTECSLDSTGPYYAGGIRNNTDEKKVYYFDSNGLEELLLYDFTLDVGDTVPMSFINDSYPYLYVESIDSVLIGDHFRKSYIYAQDTYPPITVIEGIGAETGLLEPLEIFELISMLRCYHQDHSLLWINPNVDSCNLETDTCLTISIPERISDNRLLLIYPNPASDIIYLYLSPEILIPSTDIRIEIYNSFGEKVGESQVPSGQDVYSFDVSCLSNGLYVTVIKENQRVISIKKFLIAK
jgi:hypothetical protein